MHKPNNRNIIYAWEPKERRKKGWYPTDWTIVKKSKIGSVVEEEIKKIEEHQRKSLSQFFTSRSSVHGVKYILDSELYFVEKIFWLILVSVLIVFAAQQMAKIVTRFQSEPTEITIESLSHRVSFLTFPSVTICPKKRVDWNKAMDLEKKIIPSNDSRTIILYRRLINVLSKMGFAKFEELEHFREEDIVSSGLAHMNLTDILYKTVSSCQSLFTNCFWSYQNQTCCDIFHLQKTEYGFCYSFNSATSEEINPSKKLSPKKAAAYGTGSGLKFTLHLGNIEFPPDFHHNDDTEFELPDQGDEYPRALILINDSEAWPNSGQEIQAGVSVSVTIHCFSGYSTQEVLDLNPSKVPCRHQALQDGHKYNQQACLSECKQTHAKRYCGCNPSFYFPQTETRECNFQDLICLLNNNDRFTNYQMRGDVNYQEMNSDIMTCDCLPACDFTNYDSKSNAVPIRAKNNIEIDIHYGGPASIRYKRKVVFGRLFLMVSVGGIFNLFVGGSIISVLEFVYIFIIGVLRRCFEKTKKAEKSQYAKNSLIYFEKNQNNCNLPNVFYVSNTSS